MEKKTEGGAIEYRKRLRDAEAAAAAKKEAGWREAHVVDPPVVDTQVVEEQAVEPAVLVEDKHVDKPVKHDKHDKHDKADKTTVKHTKTESVSVKQTTSSTTEHRTPSEIREDAAAMVDELLTMSDAKYNSAMQKLSAEDPVLYTAVVDAIKNTDAVGPDKA